MNKKTELKPCPFCGGEAHTVLYHNQEFTYIRHYVKCQRCFATTDKFKERETAVKTWNWRTDV